MLSQAQNAATSELHVTVKDPKGAVVTNATVAARDGGKAFERSTTANSDGDYHLIALPPGVYIVTVESSGFAKAEVKDVTVTVGESAELPVALVVSGGQTSITVTSEAALIETTRTSTTETVDQRSIDNLPINGRNYIDFTKTNSQVVKDNAPSIGAAPTSGLNFGGQRARANLVNVDGFDAVDNSTNGVRSTVSQEAVREFQIITNGYAAEYGRASGGVVNIVTRSGSNDLHGSAYGFLRNRKFQAVNPFSTVKDPAYTRVQAGFAVGGALKKDRTFYYFAYETTRRHETGFSSIGAGNYGLAAYDPSYVFGAPDGVFNIQATPEQAGFLAAIKPIYAGLPPNLQQAIQQYTFLVGGSSGIAVDGIYPASFSLITPPIPNQLQQFPTSCNPSNTTCNGLPTSFHSLSSQAGNFPVFEGTSVYSLRLDHNINANNRLLLRGNVSPSTVDGIEVNGENQTFGQNAYSRTSRQSYRDWAGAIAETAVFGNNKVNEARFQYSRRGLNFNFSKGLGGSDVSVNIPGFAFTGREPFSFIRRTEERFQFSDNFSWSIGPHDTKFGVDFNYLPLSATFTVNYGGVTFFSGLDPSQLGFPDLTQLGLPATFQPFTGVQALGLGLPSIYVQGIGNPHDAFSNKPLGLFWQDSWKIRHNVTLNYGLRYDVEFGPKFAAPIGLAGAAYNALGIQKGVQNDTNNFAPRLGIAIDPGGDGKTLISGSYGIFYDHPLLGLYFLGDASDGSKTGQLEFFPGAPCDGSAPGSPFNLNASNVFQGTLGLANCFPAAGPALGYLPAQQRFDSFDPTTLFTNQGYLAAGLPLISQPFGYPQAKNFVFGYSNQANLTVQRDLGKGFGISVAYNFNGGRHLNRPIGANAAYGDLTVANWRAALADPNSGVTLTTSPLAVGSGNVPCDPLDPTWVSAGLVSFFRPGGVNPSIANALISQGAGGCVTLANALLAASGKKFNTSCDPFANAGDLTGCIPFSDMAANFSNGSSVYHGLSVNLRKRFSQHYNFLASYTWSHAIDDSTDLQSPLSPQDDHVPSAERSNSTFDERHRFVFSGGYEVGKVGGSGFASKLFSDWSLSTIVDVASGRPFNIITPTDTTFQFHSAGARPNVVPSGTATTSCGDPAIPSKYSPTGFLQQACFIDGGLAGTLARNAGRRPWTLFNDLRVARTFSLGEHFKLEGIMDLFNIANRYNVADVNPLYTNAGQATAASDPRQFQFALRLKW